MTSARVHYLNIWQFAALNDACRPIYRAFERAPYLVGSVLTTRDFRDVDVRLILPDDAFAQLFPAAKDPPHSDPLWQLICGSITARLKMATELPIDFQIQTVAAATAEKGDRIALGVAHQQFP